MAAKATHSLSVKTGEYTDAQGQTRGRWLRIGTVFQHDDGGRSIKLDAIPVGVPNWDGWVSVYKLDDQRDQAPARNGGYGRSERAQAPGGRKANDQYDDYIPF